MWVIGSHAGPGGSESLVRRVMGRRRAKVVTVDPLSPRRLNVAEATFLRAQAMWLEMAERDEDDVDYAAVDDATYASHEMGEELIAEVRRQWARSDHGINFEALYHAEADWAARLEDCLSSIEMMVRDMGEATETVAAHRRITDDRFMLRALLADISSLVAATREDAPPPLLVSGGVKFVPAALERGA